MTREELNRILENHKHWLNKDCDGWEKMCANLAGVNLSRATLANANLKDANFAGANLERANLEGAFLKGANLAGANLTNAILEDANLADTNLTHADLHSAKIIPFIPFVCPDTGSFIAYKKASGYIVKLQIPEDAERLSATNRKCRCDKAQVLEIQNIDGTIANITKIRSNYDETFIYEVGRAVSVDDFDENRWNECSTGIHFFINRQEAVEYRIW